MLTAVSLVPLTPCVVDVPLYTPLVVPKLNQAVVDVPLAFTVPLSVAELVVTLVAAPVTTVGANAQFSLLPPSVELNAIIYFPDAS